MIRKYALVAALVLSGAIWALTFPLTKIAILGGYRNFGIIFWSSLIAVCTLAFILAVGGRRLPLNPGALWRYLFVALCGTILPSAASYTAAEHLSAGVISVCMSLIPMMALPLAVAFGIDRATPGRMAGIALGLAGVLLIALPDASLPDPALAVFLPLALLAAFFYALEGAGLGRVGRGNLDPLQLLCGASVIAAVLSLPAAIWSGSWAVPTTPFDRADAALFLSGIVNVVAYAGYVWLVGQAGSVFAAQTAYIVTGFGVIWSMLLLRETYSIWIWAALGLIFLGVFLVQPRPRSGATLAPCGAKVTIGDAAKPEIGQ